MKLLLTGAPGTGKTTLIRRVLEHLPDAAGFFTEEIRHGRSRVGFRLVSVPSGTRRLLAHTRHKGQRVGKYGVVPGAVEEAIAEVPDAPVHVVDEIGKMECLSARFVEWMTALLDGDEPVIATVALKGEGFIDAVKRRPDVDVWEVTPANRDELAGRLAAQLPR